MTAALYCLTGGMLLQHFILLFLLRRHDKDRKDLLNRIMARDYNEYALTVQQVTAAVQKNSYKDAVARAAIRQDTEREYEG